MESKEKLERMFALEPPRTRSEIPVFPHIITWAGTVSGITQAEMIADGGTWLEALDKTYEVIGRPDVSMPSMPGDVVFTMGMRSNIPGKELGENELYQLIETPFFDDEAEYGKMLQMGWGNWFAGYMMAIQDPPMQSFDELGARFGALAQNNMRVAAFLGERGIEPSSHGGAMPIYDTLSLIRSMEEFAVDLYTNPGPIMDLVNQCQPEEDQKNIEMVKGFGGTRFCVYPMRSCAPFISPDGFEEYIWPSLKKTIETFYEAGIQVLLHADSNWTPMLKFFTELPKASIHFEFDGVTDMFDAYEVIGGWHSMRGDVPSTLLSFGTPEEVGDYCEKIVTELGMKGGVMLGSGCEVPMNAKTECVIAMMDAVKD